MALPPLPPGPARRPPSKYQVEAWLRLAETLGFHIEEVTRLGDELVVYTGWRYVDPADPDSLVIIP